MTELNPAPETDPAAEPQEATAGTPTGPAEARAERSGLPEWPAFPGAAAGRDPGVEKLLQRLGTLPVLPVADHGEVYAQLHADLVEALDEAGEDAS